MTSSFLLLLLLLTHPKKGMRSNPKGSRR